MPAASDAQSATRKSRRRWFQFSLRTLVVLVTLAAIILAWVASERLQSRNQLQIAEQLKGSGIAVDLGGPFDVQPSDRQSWWRTTLGYLLGPRVTGVFAEFSSIDLQSLAGLDNLEVLFISSAQVKDLTLLTGLSSLRVVVLNDNPVQDLSPLAGLKNVRELYMSDTRVSDLAPLAGLAMLEVIALNHTPLKDISPLSALKNVKELYIFDTQVSNEEVELLQQSLPNCKIYW